MRHKTTCTHTHTHTHTHTQTHTRCRNGAAQKECPTKRCPEAAAYAGRNPHPPSCTVVPQPVADESPKRNQQQRTREQKQLCLTPTSNKNKNKNKNKQQATRTSNKNSQKPVSSEQTNHLVQHALECRVQGVCDCRLVGWTRPRRNQP